MSIPVCVSNHVPPPPELRVLASQALADVAVAFCDRKPFGNILLEAIIRAYDMGKADRPEAPK